MTPVRFQFFFPARNTPGTRGAEIGASSRRSDTDADHATWLWRRREGAPSATPTAARLPPAPATCYRQCQGGSLQKTLCCMAMYFLYSYEHTRDKITIYVLCTSRRATWAGGRRRVAVAVPVNGLGASWRRRQSHVARSASASEHRLTLRAPPRSDRTRVIQSPCEAPVPANRKFALRAVSREVLLSPLWLHPRQLSASLSLPGLADRVVIKAYVVGLRVRTVTPSANFARCAADEVGAFRVCNLLSLFHCDRARLLATGR
jgi:hypothetical protein